MTEYGCGTSLPYSSGEPKIRYNEAGLTVANRPRLCENTGCNIYWSLNQLDAHDRPQAKPGLTCFRELKSAIS